MARNFKDWLASYVAYAGFSEAPARCHFWAGVSAIAGALRRRVWIDQGYFRWHPNFYVILVAPPGIVSKSTTVTIAMNLLRKVPGVKFGPDIVTWPALATAFASSNEAFELNGEWITQCALTLESSEFGNLVDPADRAMVDLLVSLWDGKTGPFEKATKGNGVDNVENPFINLIACTTPAWIAGNFPEYIIGGGFTSRCLFVYADKKDKYVAYPKLHLPSDFAETGTALAQDLEHISIHLCGEYKLDPGTIEFGEQWYKHHWEHKPDELDDDRFSGYLSRKQTHLHKVAMVIAAAQRDDLLITADDLALANVMISDLEKDMQKVFSRIGRTENSVQAERFIRFVHKRGLVSYASAYQYVHSAFPDIRNFEGVVTGACRAGFIEKLESGGQMWLRAKVPELPASNSAVSIEPESPRQK